MPLAQANPSQVGQMVDWPLPASIAIQLKPELAGTLEEAESARRVWPDPQHRGGAYQSYGDDGGPPDSLPADRAGDAEDLTRPLGAATAKTTTPEPAPASAAPTPTADPLEIATLELTLADPATQQLIKDFGGPLEPPPTGNAVADSIIARYGSDLASRLNQLQTAQGEVQRQYLLVLDAALAAPGPEQPGSVFTPDSETASAPEGLAGLPSRVGQHQGQSGTWVLDPEAFTSAWAQGDSPLQKAYASVHGGAGLQRVTSAPGMEHESTQWMLAGQKLQPLQQASGDSPRQASRLIDGWERIDPQEPPKLINDGLVWFDPERGWVTDPKNLEGNWLDQNFPRLMGVAFAAVGAGGIGAMVAQATGSVVAQGAAMGAVASSLNQYVSTGHVSFKSVLTSALAGGLTAGITQLPGVGQHLDGAAASFGQRLMEYTGRATLQGAIQQVVGGDFKDGLLNSLLGSVAGEVGGLIDAQIEQMSQQGSVSESQASSLRLLGRATASALRAVANPGDAAAGFAGDFLSGILGDAVQQQATQVHGGAPAPPASSPTEDEVTLPSAGPSGGRWGATAGDDGYAYYTSDGEMTVVASRIEDEPMLEDVAQRVLGAASGTLASFGHMAEGTVRFATNGLLQIGDILTGDLNHDHPIIQQAWHEQQQLGEAMVNAMLSPRQTTSRAIEAVVNRYDAAMALSDPYAQSQALGQLFNDVGQAALAGGYTAARVVRPTAALVQAAGENATQGGGAGVGSSRGLSNLGGIFLSHPG